MPTTSFFCMCCCPNKVCATLWKSTYTCADNTFSAPVAISTTCLPKPVAPLVWTQITDGTTCDYQIYVPTKCCTSDGDCTQSAAPPAPTDHSGCHCCPKNCYSKWQCIYTCADGTFATPTFIANFCEVPGSVSTAWTFGSGDSTSCIYYIYVDTHHCCTTVGECTMSAVPAAPTDHGECLCCSCRDISLGGCTGCNDYPPLTVTVSFTGGSLQTSCLDCPPNVSYKVTTGALAGLSFTLPHTAACGYQYLNAAGPITVTQYSDDTCTTAVATATDINVSLGIAGGTFTLTVQVGGFFIFQGTWTRSPPVDCCAPFTLTDVGSAGSCFPSIVLGWGATAHVTPC